MDADALPLAVGDLVVILLFVYVGTINHDAVGFPPAGVDAVAYVVGVAVPFLVGWVVAAPLVGAYSAGAVESAKASVPLAVRSWIPAAVIGLLIRATPWVDGGVAPTFAVVMLVVGSVCLGVWRYVAARFV
ncbi:hypothetical protein K933_06977 [Candidatus Halobonum tyrrellensis G22]|uniref:DUF3054 domain-containing protein n=1 Tax=Candidatus Halobonum tyrrellensis G22 TaxID=1324957 RepID=V4HLP5_9EURY|nr:hypothetical protein K933_06977 [Candidatus Halobonum tyrrellensis G22]